MCSNSHDGMICLEVPYFSLNEILLRATGLWPFQQQKLARIQFSLFFSILTTAVIFQITTFATSKCTSKFVVKVLSSALSCTMVVIHYSSFYINIETVRNLLTELHHICEQLKDENEIAIIEKYGYKGKRFTTVLTALSASFIFAVLVNQFCPGIFDVILSINKSRSHHLYLKMEYFLDQEKYLYFILLHISLAISIAVAVLIAIGTMFIAYLQHTCGMFRIARYTIYSYRIEYAMGVDMLQNICLTNEHLVYKGIVCAINIHRQATKLSKCLISNFDTTYFFLVIMSVISLSLNLFQVATFQNDISEIVLPMIIIFFISMYLFFGNYMGQHITDHNNHVFATVYNVQWYMYPLHVQKLMLFLLQRGGREFHLTCGGLFVASFECFATVKISEDRSVLFYCHIFHAMIRYTCAPA
ncbi:uncharacterized protein LOC105286930 isoform X2 [Ooceraea biroi]|uniref:uncharacterized protein LOC105286930 isoform X2 n=1 Tax=Ooceraea biroi TaxID=2015173 RepID=UPI0009716D18|nr:uncharacterized protein LOC105286930 isoform X2 [Ooceraea biroi]